MSEAKKEEKAEKKGGKKLPLIIGIVVLVAMLFVGKTVMGSKGKEEETKKSKKASKKKKAKHADEEQESSAHSEKAKGGAHGEKSADPAADAEEEEEEHDPAESFVALEPDFTVNLVGEGGHYLRASMALGVRKGFTKEKVEHHIAPVRDRIITLMSARTYKELNTPAGKRKLKRQIMEEVNAVFEEEKEEPIVEVCFTAFATQ
jgi:flagellar FliL protein